MLFTLKLIGVLMIVASVLGIVYNLSPSNQKIKWPWIPIPALLGIGLLVIMSIIVKVGPQEVGVIITPTGVREVPIKTGWHLIPPWNKVEFMDKTVWVYTFSNKAHEGKKADADAIWTPTKDGIKMGLDVSVSWAIDPEYAAWILQNVSEADGSPDARYDWIEENFIRAKTKSVMALGASNYTPIELYSNKRQELQDLATQALAKELKVYHLVLRQIDIREVFYNQQYEQSITNKKLAEQEALRLVEVTKQKVEQLKQAEIDKNMAIEKAKGESEALKIKGQSISSNPKIIQLEWIQKWNGSLPTYMMGKGDGIIVNLNN